MLFWIVQTWCVIGILMLLVMLLTRSRKLSPAVLHALWVVLLLKSLTPPFVEWPYSIPSWSSSSPVVLEGNQRGSTIAIAPIAGAPMPASPTILNDTVAAASLGPSSSAPTSSASAPLVESSADVNQGIDSQATQYSPIASTVAFSWLSWKSVLPALVVTWVLGSCLTLAIELFRIQKLHRALRTGRSDEVIASETAAVAKQLRIATIPHRVVRGVTTPLIWSCGAPVLIWPASLSDLTAEARRGLIAHELAHVKRRDHWIAWLELATKVLWWWNPLQAVLRRNLREAADQACDAYVVNSLKVPRRLYAETLLAICESQKRSSAPLASLAAIQSDKRGLENRLRNLMGKTRAYSLSRVSTAVVALLGLAVLPGWTQEPKKVPQGKETSSSNESSTATGGKKKRFWWKAVPSNIKQAELPAGWQIPELFVDASGDIPVLVSGTGIIEDDMNRPVPDAVVVLSIYGSIYGVTKTNSAGQYSLDGINLPNGVVPEYGAFQLQAVHPQLGYGDVWVFTKDLNRTDRSQLATGHHKIRLARFGEVRGKAVAPDGMPVAGAEISMAMDSNQYSAKPMFGPVAKSEANGEFTIPNVPPTRTATSQRLVRFDVRHKDWPRLLVTIEDTHTPVVCKFNEGIRITGKVQFSKESQKPEATISVFSTVFGQQIGADGTIDFHIDRRLSGKSIVISCFPRSENQSYSLYHAKVEARESGNAVTFNLQPSRTITGVVKSHDEKPISLQSIQWKNKDEDVRVGEVFDAEVFGDDFRVLGNSVKLDGNQKMITYAGKPDLSGFEFDAPRGAGTLCITYSISNQPRQGMVYFPGKSREHSVAVDAGEADLPLDIVLPQVPPTEFILRNTQGELIKGGKLTLAWMESRYMWTETYNSFASQSLPQSRSERIADGKAATTLPETGWMGVLVESDTKEYGWTTIAENPNSPIEIVVEKPIGWVTGRASVDSQPVANLPIQLMLNVHRSQAIMVALPPLATTTDAMGEFRLPNIAPLSGYLFPSIPNGMLREGRGVEVNLNPGQSLRVDDIRFLRPQGSVAGQVVTPDGKPVAGVEVHIRRGDFASPLNDGLFWAKDIAKVGPVEPKLGPNGWPALMHRNDIACAAVSDADGKFEIPNLPNGSVNLYVMRITNAGPEIPVQNVIVEVGKQDVKLVCPPPATAPVVNWHSPSIGPSTYIPLQPGSGPRDPGFPMVPVEVPR